MGNQWSTLCMKTNSYVLICNITHFISLDVTIGFDPSTYSVNEASMTVKVCARILDGSLQRDAVVTLSTSDGTATGLLLYSTTKIVQSILK